MSTKFRAGEGSFGARPDILMPYKQAEGLSDSARRDEIAHALVYVRPETNRISYEAEIVSAIRKRKAEVVYTANLNGSLFSDCGILRSHYASQFRFASDPGGSLAEFPEIAAAFEAHFGISAARARLVGSLEGLDGLGLSPEELFADIVPARDFLACRGQTFKRVGDAFVVNYDLPAILGRYTPEANVFVVLARIEGPQTEFYMGLNRAIHDEILSRPDTPFISGDKFAGLAWNEQVRRTYHISANRVMALLDMSDFIFLDGERRMSPAETPLGRAIVDSGELSAGLLEALKERHLCRLAPRGNSLDALAYLPCLDIGMNFGNIVATLKSCARYL
jgi:hypothetical protein